ncbi:MAG: hypothetical protein AAB250_11675, partial [Bdellovibrionota bacterium]
TDRTQQDQLNMRSQLEMARTEMDAAQASGNMWAMQQANGQYSSILGQGMIMANVTGNQIKGRIAELQGYQRQGWMDSSDYSDFTSATMQLQRDLEYFRTGGKMSSSTLPTSMTMSEGFMSARTDALRRYEGAYGAAPVLPRLPYSTSPSSQTGAPTNVRFPNPTFTSVDPRTGNRQL